MLKGRNKKMNLLSAASHGLSTEPLMWLHYWYCLDASWYISHRFKSSCDDSWIFCLNYLNDTQREIRQYCNGPNEYFYCKNIALKKSVEILHRQMMGRKIRTVIEFFCFMTSQGELSIKQWVSRLNVCRFALIHRQNVKTECFTDLWTWTNGLELLVSVAVWYKDRLYQYLKHFTVEWRENHFLSSDISL